MFENIVRVALSMRTGSTDRANHFEQLLRAYAAASIGGDLCEGFTDVGGSGRRPVPDTGFALMELIRQLTAADATLCLTLRPQGPQSELEISAVDEFLVGVCRSLAGPHGAVWPSLAGDVR